MKKDFENASLGSERISTVVVREEMERQTTGNWNGWFRYGSKAFFVSMPKIVGSGQYTEGEPKKGSVHETEFLENC